MEKSTHAKKLPSHNPHVGTWHHGPGILRHSSVLGFPIAFRNNQSPYLPYIIHAPPQNPLLFGDMLKHCMYIPNMYPEDEEWIVVEDPRVG